MSEQPYSPETCWCRETDGYCGDCAKVRIRELEEQCKNLSGSLVEAIDAVDRLDTVGMYAHDLAEWREHAGETDGDEQ